MASRHRGDSSGDSSHDSSGHSSRHSMTNEVAKNENADNQAVGDFHNSPIYIDIEDIKDI